MKLLLVDIGNTTADFRLYDTVTRELSPLIRPFTQDALNLTPEAIITDLENAKLDATALEAIIYVSVVPKLNETIRGIGARYQLPVESLRHDLPVDWDRFKLPNLNLLGADFVANFYGVEASYQLKNCAVVALGTATTIFVIQEGNFIGTTISPGIQTSLQGLYAQAALLSEMQYYYLPQALGHNTFESMSIGTINGHYYMIQGLLAEIRKTMPLEQVLFTGGNMSYYRDISDTDIRFDETLIFKGLIYLYEQKYGNQAAHA